MQVGEGSSLSLLEGGEEGGVSKSSTVGTAGCCSSMVLEGMRIVYACERRRRGGEREREHNERLKLYIASCTPCFYESM